MNDRHEQEKTGELPELTPRARRHRYILIALTAGLILLPLILMVLRIMERI